MSKAKDSRQNIDHALDVIISGLSADTCMRRSCLCGKGEGLLNSKRREMNVVLGTVLDVTTVELLDVVGAEGVVMNSALDGAVFGALVGKDAQERSATGSGPTKNHWR